ncbi:hypothetical protein Mgra_00000035 [Meloidogyne graminicola]|uniref:Uncharacterized protein n=1 Tax=Meloidogyne graminicola TaxID=189291 RepID=A0A8T0A491_9BILA|nr:hypothetical protein Mgra_00000035 [Meloidogyne graminicola]
MLRYSVTHTSKQQNFNEFQESIPSSFNFQKVKQEKTRRGVRIPPSGLFRIDSTCQCHDRDYPPWTGEIHGMSQALLSKSLKLRVFWWMVLVLCTCCGTATTVLVIIEYIRGPTASSTTIRLVVPSLELPAITICPKVPDAFNFDAIYRDINEKIDGISTDCARDLVSYWIGGSGLENMDSLPEINETYMQILEQYYNKWRRSIETKQFFFEIHEKFGYKCSDLFVNCELGGKKQNCCDTIFRSRPTEADDIGRLVLEMKALPSITSPQYNFFQPQIIIYVNDNFEQVVDFPRFYLYPHEWNRMHFVARFIELLEHPNDCTNELIGKDANCFVRNWLTANVIDAFNCTVPYLEETKGISLNLPICDCVPGCSRWEYSVSLQQSPALQPFVQHEFNLEISFYDLQYEHVKEVYTISVPGFMSQIGGQFGFFLGLSIITMIQIVIYALSAFLSICIKMFRKILQNFNNFLKGNNYFAHTKNCNINKNSQEFNNLPKNLKRFEANGNREFINNFTIYEETSFGVEQIINNNKNINNNNSTERIKQLTKQRRISTNLSPITKNDYSSSGFIQKPIKNIYFYYLYLPNLYTIL